MADDYIPKVVLDRWASSDDPAVRMEVERRQDQLWLAENRGVEAVMRAVRAEVTDTGSVYIDVAMDRRELERRIEKELGR